MKNICMVVCLALILLILSACVPDYRAVRDVREEHDLSYIMVFEGERISVDLLVARVLLRVAAFELEVDGYRGIWEFMDGLPGAMIDDFFPGTGTAFERIRAIALEELVDSLVVEHHAARHGIVVTDAERAAARAVAEEIHADLSRVLGVPFPVSVDVLAPIYIEEVLLERLLAEMVDTLSTDDPEFLEYFEIYIAPMRSFLNTVYIHYIAAETYEAARAAQARLAAGEYAGLVAYYLCVDFDPSAFGQINLWHLPRITASSHPYEKVEIFALGPGEVSQITEADGKFIVVRVEQKIIPDDLGDEKDSFMARIFAPYTIGRRLETWRRTAVIELNRHALESVTLSDIHEMF